MKLWLFALLESLIAALGLAAYFWADSVILATVAVVAAGMLGVVQPLLAARQSRRLSLYRESQFQKSVDTLDRQVDQLLSEVIDPPLPHPETLRAVFDGQFPEQADALGAQYERLVKAIQSNSFAAPELAAALADKLHQHPVGTYLSGLAALSQDQWNEAHQLFTSATRQKPNWIAPWLGWATTAYRQQMFAELKTRHPHVCGVELAPYDVGDEQTFINLQADDRDELVERFQMAAQALGNFYTLAELQFSKAQIDQSHQQLRRAA